MSRSIQEAIDLVRVAHGKAIHRADAAREDLDNATKDIEALERVRQILERTPTPVISTGNKPHDPSVPSG